MQHHIPGLQGRSLDSAVNERLHHDNISHDSIRIDIIKLNQQKNIYNNHGNYHKSSKNRDELKKQGKMVQDFLAGMTIPGILPDYLKIA